MHLRALDIERGLVSNQVLRENQEKQRQQIPFFEVLAMRVIFDAGNHEIGQVTVFMCNHVDKTILKPCQPISITI